MGFRKKEKVLEKKRRATCMNKLQRSIVTHITDGRRSNGYGAPHPRPDSLEARPSLLPKVCPDPENRPPPDPEVPFAVELAALPRLMTFLLPNSDPHGMVRRQGAHVMLRNS